MSETNDMHVFLATAESIVKDAGQIARESFGATRTVQEKARGDLVTEADLAVEQHVLSQLADAFPRHGFVSEEAGEQSAEAEFVWILDPIDGTKYFNSGIPLYSVSLALRHGTDSVLGVVYNPETDQLFSATHGNGARLNGTEIRCAEESRLSEATLCLEIPNRHFPWETNRTALEVLARLIDQVDRIRIIGVSALGLCYCASGAFDVYLNISTGSKPWDLAAGLTILKEAGATVTMVGGNQIVGGPPRLHDELIQLLETQLDG